MKDNLYVKERLNDGASTFDGYLLSRANWYSSCDMEYAMQDQFYKAHKLVNSYRCLVSLNSTHVIGSYGGICNAGTILHSTLVCKFAWMPCNIE